ncbi:MAG: transcription antitermination factor NusB [Microthrixaceae bacterium]
MSGGDDTTARDDTTGREPPPELPVVAGGRAEARERAVHLLYEARMKDLGGGEVLARLPIAPDPYAAGLVDGVEDHREELDAIVGRLAHGWTPERMAALDLVVLEVGCYELAHRPDVPTEVVLSEATELASRYGSTDDSAGFVNGVLAAAARELRPD